MNIEKIEDTVAIALRPGLARATFRAVAPVAMARREA